MAMRSQSSQQISPNGGSESPSNKQQASAGWWLPALEKGHPPRIPVKLAPSHKNVLKDRTLKTSVALHKRRGAWWLTVSFDDEPALQTTADAPPHRRGYILGTPEQEDLMVKNMVSAIGCVSVLVDYRLAPETRHPDPAHAR
jgi:hypothetical protein